MQNLNMLKKKTNRIILSGAKIKQYRKKVKYPVIKDEVVKCYTIKRIKVPNSNMCVSIDQLTSAIKHFRIEEY